MTPQSISDLVLRDTPSLRADDPLEQAARTLLDSGLPALPVVDAADRFAGIFGERECMAAIFPSYVGQLKYAGFVSHSLDDALERNEAARDEPLANYMNTEHVDVGSESSDLQVVETFLHHRVLVVPVVDGGVVQGVITRKDFFQAVAGRFLG